MNYMDISIKVSENEEMLLRLKIDETNAQEGIVVFDLASVTDGKNLLKLQLKNDKLTVLRKSY
jgi:hypothetical protein